MRLHRPYRLFILIAALLAVQATGAMSQILNIKSGATIHLSPGAVLSVNDGININAGASLVHSNAGESNFWLSGKFRNDGSYVQNDFGIMKFYGNRQDSIVGPSQTFERLWLMKSGSSMVSLPVGTNVTINKALRLVTNGIFNIHRSNLIIEKTANIYPDSVSTYLNDPLLDHFGSQKFIMTSGERDLGGSIIRKVPQYGSLAEDLNLRFPIGTPLDTANPVVRNYSPARYVFSAGEATTGANASIKMRCIAAEHSKVEVSGVSLKKYWKVEDNDFFVEPGGYSVRFNYASSEVQGYEEAYMLCLFFRPNDGPDGTYYINAGAGYGVEPVNHRFYVDEVNKKDTLGKTRVLIDGEWTAGQEEAINVHYYSIADGDWEDPATWSKQGYLGVPASTYPATVNDKVFIGNGKTVFVSSTSPEVNAIRVQQRGRLAVTSYNSWVQGDSLFIEKGGTLAVSSDEGFTNLSNSGNVQTLYRSYSQYGIYEYIGNRKQVTGDGLPDIIGSIIINKANPSDTVSLTKSVLVKDSLVINNGIFHLFRNGNFTAHGETGDTTNRRIIMRGGELLVQNFPIKYKNAVFNAGTITFDGTGSFKIPSSVNPSPGDPAVTQYHNLKLQGARGSNTYCTFDPTGEIRINGDMGISGLSFDPTPISDRFIVTGSTVVFNGDSAQTIQTGYPAPTALVYRPKFHKLIISGSGAKTLLNPNDSDPANNYALIRDTLVLRSGSFVSGGYHIKVLSGWKTNAGANFDAGSGLVTFEADGKVVIVQSNSIPFNNVNIGGTANGEVRFLDSMFISGNLNITTSSFKDANSKSLRINGNFVNKGAFAPQNGRVYFTGTGNQTLEHSGKGNFYNITVNKSSGNVLLEGDSLIKVTNNLTLLQGNVSGRASVSVPNKPILVDGTISRPGGTPGHIDGRLRLPTTENANSKLFTIGYGNNYMPIDLNITGYGGASGYLDAYVVIDLDAPNITRNIIETQNPNGPELDSTKNIRKIWVMHADTTRQTRFELGAARQYNAEFFFTAGDIRNGANPSSFEIYHRDSTANVGRWRRPTLDARNPLSTKFIDNQVFNSNSSNYFIIGEPKVFTYYSIADGNFNAAETWSTAGYLSDEVALRAPSSNDNVRIGNGKTVTLTANHTVNANRLLVVETGRRGFPNGHLVFGDDSRTISGSGTFRLDSGAAITIKHSEGIVNSGNNGCVRTTTRQYNYNNYNSGHFIYAGTGNQSTGNGFPNTTMTLQINKPSGTLTFTGTTPITQLVQDSLYLASGNTNLSTVIMKISGNLVVDAGATFNPGTRRTSNTNVGVNNRNDTTAWEGVVVFNGPGEQHIRGSFADSPTNPLVFNRMSISKPSGVVISHLYIQAPMFWLKMPNRANFDVATHNKFLLVYGSGVYGFGRRDMYSSYDNNLSMADPIYGYVQGRLIRYMEENETPRYFPIGTGTKYSPLIINRNERGGTGGQTAGLLEVQAVNGNHPNFNTSQINPNTNVQRYYEITCPVGLTPAYVQGNRALSVYIMLTKDEPRGGINPLNYKAYRLISGSNWTRTSNISTTNTYDTLLKAYPNDPTLGGNNIFSAPSQFTATNAIVLMIGEDANNVNRIFYAKKSGNWTDPSTWANESANILYEDTEVGYAISGNAANDYPRLNTGATKDFAVIGNGHTVTFNTSAIDLQYVLVEKSAGGMGHLIMPGENYFRTNQYVQKNGGKLSIGSTSGIVKNSNTGNVRQISGSSIINFDLDGLGNNNFAYIGTASDAVQNTGSGLPPTIASLEIDYNRSAANRYVELTNNVGLTIKDSLVFKNGRFRNYNGNRTITILGDIVNYSSDAGFHNQTNPSNRTIYLADTLNQTIRGTETVFPQTLNIDKPKGAITTLANVKLEGAVQFRSDTKFILEDNTILTFGNSATIDSLENFGTERLFKVSGGANTARVRKTYPTGTSNREFTFPIGEDSSGLRSIKYGEAKFSLTNQTFSNGNYLEIALRSQYTHPAMSTPNPLMLSKYWSVVTNNISLGSGSTSVRLRYNDSEVHGNILQYAPTLYRRPDVESRDPGWSFQLFNASNLQIDTTNKYIIVDGAITLANHDWTAGDPASFVRPRMYWSRANGDWSNPNIWTNYNPGNPHTSDVPALNTPGFFEGDTVLIGANHVITYDKTAKNYLDSLGIGMIAAYSTSPELRFKSDANSHKSLLVQGSVAIGQTGLLSKVSAGSGSSIDTLKITKIFENNGNAGRGVDVHPNTSRNIRLSFEGNTHSYLRGEGNYTSIGSVRVAKADSSHNLHNESQAFSTKFSQAVKSIPSVDFLLDAGMYYHDNPADITLSTDGDGDAFLGDLVGLTIRNGNVIYSDGLICGLNSSVWLMNGNLTIGNSKDENFQYESVTTINIEGGSNLYVAGSMRRRFLTSAVDFRLKDNANIEVMIKGAKTNTLERRAAFDFGEANSVLTMTGGKVLIYRPMELSDLSEKDPDCFLNAANSTITGGTVQFGHPDTTMVGSEDFNLIASAPFWNLDVANTYGKDLLLGSPVIAVQNDLLVRSGASLNQNGNSLNIGGDFVIDGTYKNSTVGTRRVSFSGNSSATPATKQDQTVKIKNNGNDTFYDLVLNKNNGGKVTLSGDPAYPYSNFIATNTLEFSIGNKAIIVAPEGRYVQVGSDATDLASIQRFGTGHVVGELRRWINDGIQSKLFTVGTTTDYTPADVLTSAGNGTPGLLSVTAYGVPHPDLASSDIHQDGTNIDRYWKVVPSSVNPFALGAGRTYNLTLFFKKGLAPAGDQKVGTSFGTFEHFFRSPAWDDPTGTWRLTTPDFRTDSSTSSVRNELFGDYIIAEIAGARFYSRQTGNWNDINTWSNAGYTGAVAYRLPNVETDRVFIGAGRIVTVNNVNPKIRSVTIEKHNGLPGKLIILGERYLRGLSFELQDSCYLATDDAFGFTSITGPTPNIGAIRTSSVRSFGKGIIEYIGELNQAMGDGPSNPKTIVINNTGLVGKTVSFSNASYIIEDSVLVKSGDLSLGLANVGLRGNLVADGGTRVTQGYSTVRIIGNGNQYFVMNDSAGFHLYNLAMQKSAGNLILTGSYDTTSLHIHRSILFDDANTGNINARLFDKNVMFMYDTCFATRLGTGHIDGKLLSYLGANAASRTYPIGFDNVYLPAELTFTVGTGVAGFVSGIAMSPPNPNVSRIKPDKKINYYWNFEPKYEFEIGDRLINTKFTFPPTEVLNLTGGKPDDARIMRKSNPIEEPLWSNREYAKLTWKVDTASVEIANPADYWSGLGEFYIGEKYRLVFYSKEDGLWNNFKTWALDENRTIPAPEGEFPNPSGDDMQDSVVIGWKDKQHNVKLNVGNTNISGLTLLYDGRLDMHNDGTMLDNKITSSGNFTLADSATIALGGEVNPTTSLLPGFSSYNIGPLSNIEFYGTQTISPSPFGLINYPGNMVISGVGTKIVDTPITVLGNLFIKDSSILDVQAIDALTVKKNVINKADIMNRGVIEVGE